MYECDHSAMYEWIVGRVEGGIMLVGKAWITQTYEEASAGVGDVCGEASVSIHRGS